MNTRAVRRSDVHLLETVDRLVAEFNAIGAGSPLGCHSRAVTVSRRSGVSPELVPNVAADVARLTLVRRGRSWRLAGTV